jgi:hypothetical protein
MNALTHGLGTQAVAHRKNQAVGILERVCQAFEPTPTQRQLAEDRYGAVGGWVSEAETWLFESAKIYAQGSFATGTTVRPIDRDEFDVDLVIFFPHGSQTITPSALKRMLGDRLRAHGTYRQMLEEMGRCWRVNYANEFHLDITPSIPNPACYQDGELVPDKKAQCWKASNPTGYRDWFNKQADLQPRIRLQKAIAMDEKRAGIEPFPKHSMRKGVLRRIVQLSKRHRDLWFQGKDPTQRPISVILNTLAAQAYKFCVGQDYDTEFDLMHEVVRLMPVFIDKHEVAGQRLWCIWNPTASGENFAERWNTDPARADAFFEWHASFASLLERITQPMGTDVIARDLKKSFGPVPVQRAFDDMISEVEAARQGSLLSIAPAAGLVIGAPTPLAMPVPRNTFYGAG